MGVPYRFERIGNVDQADNGSDNENDSAERLLNLTLCGRREVRETARACVCCVEEPESENKFERGTLSTSIRIRRVLVLFFFFFFSESSLNMKSFWAKM